MAEVHGLRRSAEYNIWNTMISRCYRPSQDSYYLYGERGIRVCDRWRISFASFYADMGPRPSSEHSLDRLDSNGHYEPDNCKWSTREEQARNKRNIKLISFRGQTKTLSEWATQTGISLATLWERLYILRWPVPRALTVNPKTYHKRRQEERYE